MNFFNCILLLLLGLVPFTGSATIVEGSFFMNVPISQPVIANLNASHMKSISLFLLPDDTLKIEIFIIDTDSIYIEFKGEHAMANKMLWEEEKVRQHYFYGNNYRNICGTTDSAEAYTECMDRNRLFLMTRYDSLWDSAPVHPFLKDYIYLNTIFREINAKILYPGLHNYNLKLEHTNKVVDSTFFAFLDTIQIENSQALSFESYRLFTGYYVSNYILSARIRGGFDYQEDSLYPILFDIADSVYSGEVGCYQKTWIMGRAFEERPYEFIQSRYEKLLRDCAETPYAEKAERNYRKTVMLRPGNIPPDIIAPTMDNDTFNLSAFKGKPVVLDFWASWCVPCIMDMTNFRARQQELEKEGVAFIYISIDEDDEQWRNAVKMLEIGGIHLRVEGRDAPIAEAYNISGIPQTFLIDKEGKMANPTPPRNPDALEELIRNLMKKE